MGRKMADLWEHAERLNKRFKCHFCEKDFPGGVVRLRSHLSGVKGGGIQLCTKVSEEAKNDALSSLNVVNKKRKTGPSSSDSDGGSSDICDANCNSEVGYSLAKFFWMSDINCNMVESLFFTSLVKTLSPGSALPSSTELERKLIPSFKTEVERYVSDAKKSWIETGCTLIPIFELNEKGGRSFLSIFGCSRERTVLLYTFEVPTNIDLVAPFLQQSVHLVVDAVGSRNIVQCVVDASQYGKYFSEFLGSKFPHVYLTKCAAREVQFMFEEICQEVGWVGRTFTIIKSIVDYIWSDTTILTLMSKYTNGKELKQSSGVNLLSSYKMLESILEVKEHLVQLVQSPEWFASGYGVGQRGSEVTACIKDPKTWELGEKIRKGLRSLSQVLCTVDSHDSSSGYLYGLMEIVEHSISQLKSTNQDMYQRLSDIYMLKKGKILSEFHCVAAFLNPAYLHTEQAKNVDWNPVISNILDRFIAEGDRKDFVNEVYQYRKILSDGSKLYEATAAKAYHPCQWWETFGQQLTSLRNLAIRILSQPCSISTCKSSMHTVEAILVKEQRELSRGITDLDLKMNAILMERFNIDKSREREIIVLEEFSKQMSNNGESTSRPLSQLKLRFLTEVASPIRTSQNVEGENGFRIRVCLVDPSTGHLVQDGIPSTLPLTISVVDGHFTHEGSSEEHSTREYFNLNELSGSYMTGDLKVNLNRGEGTLGTFSFNCSSRCTESGKFKLAVKTQTGDSAGFRIIEGISNAFIVEDAEEVSTELPMVYVDPQNDSLFGNTDQEWFSNFDSWIQNESDSHLPRFGDASINYQCSGFNQSLAKTAARRVKKKAQMRKLRSRGRGVTFKRESQALGRKRKGKGVLKPRRPVYSSGSNNVNQQEDGEEVNSEPVELEGIDSLSSTSAMALFGVRVGSSSGAKPVEETNEVALTTHPSTALQLSLTGDGVLDPQEGQLASANNVNQQEDGEPMALKGETHEGHSPTAPVMLTTEECKEISNIGVRKRSLGRCDAEVHEQGGKVGTFDIAAKAAMAYDAVARQFLGPYEKRNFPITSEPEIHSAGRGNQISNEDDTPHEVEENRFVGNNYESDSSVKSTPAKKEVKSTGSKDIQGHPRHPAFLNPAYMLTEQAKNVEWNPVKNTIMERFIAEGDRGDFVDEVQEYMKILSDETKLFETTAAKSYHPCQWWESCAKKLPILRNLAIKILSQPCSTSICKSSMRTVEAALVKEQRELARGITDLDLKMNAILMERFTKDTTCKREKIVLEEFSKQRSNNSESTSRPLRQLKLCFMTVIASPIRTSQNVEGEKGCRIHVCLEDPSTGRVVQEGLPSTLPLTISVLDGHFSNEASSEEHSTRDYFNRNELSGECPYITGDLGVTLNQGEGTLGKFSFNYSSVDRESGQFRLAVKTHTGVCGGFRILEGISNAFTVEDAEDPRCETSSRQEQHFMVPEDIMNLSINGQSQVPPGFRFHPTEEEIVDYYLRKRVAQKKIDLNVIRLGPWDIQESCGTGSTPQSDWYFFSHKNKKCTTGTRTNRSTAPGSPKATDPRCKTSSRQEQHLIMSEDIMNLSINGQSQVPPGFRFHPTEEEIVDYYLRKKVVQKKIDLEVDLNKLESWDIQERCGTGLTPQSDCGTGSTLQSDWYFFSHKNKKCPTGTRTNLATAPGFRKATGRHITSRPRKTILGSGTGNNRYRYGLKKRTRTVERREMSNKGEGDEDADEIEFL